MANNLKERLTSINNWKREGANALCVAAGVLGATLLDRLVQKGVEKFLPDYVQHAGYIKSAVVTLGGLVLSVSQDDTTPMGNRMRLFGYGVTGAGIVSGVRMIPVVDQLLSGDQPVNGLKGLNGVENLLNLNLGEFGKSDNIKKASTIEAETVDVDLPDLGNTNANRTAYGNPSNDTETIDVELEELTAEFI